MAATLQSIYDRLHGADPYHPYSATTFQDWATEAGDILTINRGEDGYVVPVHSAHLSWRGSPQVVLNGTGNKKRESVEKAAQRKYARGGGGYRSSQMLFHEFTDEDGLLRSALMMTSSELRTEFQASNSAVYSVISQTASEIRTEVGNAESGIYSSISETADQIRTEVNSANSDVYSAISQTASEIRSEVGNVESGLRSTISQTASQIRSEVANVNSNIRSVINQTASNIMLEVGKSAHVYHQYGDPASTEDVKDKDIWIKDAGVQNHGKAATFTHGQLGSFKLADFYGSEIYVRDNGSWVRVGGDQLQEYNYAQIKVEQDRIALITDGMSGDYAEFIVELGRIHSQVEDIDEGLSSVIEQTASMIRSAVWTANSEMYSEILQTQSMIRSEVANSESGIRSTITQTASGLQIQISRKRAVYLQPTDPSLTNTMYNGDIWIVDNNIYSHAAMATLTHATLGTYSLYDYMGKMSWVWKGGQWIPFYDERAKTKDETLIEINDKNLMVLYGDVNDKYSQFLQEKTQIRSIVEDKTNRLGSEIMQTASEIRTSVWSANSQIYSSISQTASTIRLEVTNKISSVQSSITQTASSIRSEVNTANSQIYSAITQTASSIRLEVTNKVSSLQSQINQSADKIALVVQGTGNNAKIKAAEIVAAINNGASSVVISADHIQLDGDTVASSLRGKSIAASFLGCDDFQVTAQMSVDYDADWKLDMGLTTAVRNTIVGASVSNNTLTLTTLGGDEINFSKATTLTPSWSGSAFPLTMTAKQTNSGTSTTVASKTIGFGGLVTAHDIEFQLANGGTPTKVANVSNLISCPVKVQQLTTNNPVDRYSKDVQFSVATLLQEKTATNLDDVTPDSNYIGLKKVTININPSVTGSFSGDVLTVRPKVGTSYLGTNKFTLGFGGNVGTHSIELLVMTNGSPTRNGTTGLSIPVRVAQNNGSSVAPTKVYDKTLTYLSCLQTKTVTPTENVDVTPGSSFVGLSKVSIDVSAAYNSGYDANHSLFIGDEDYVAKPSSIPLSLGESIEVWPYFKKSDGSTYQWGPKYTITAASDPHPTRFQLRCTEATPVYPGSNIKNYTFTIQSPYSFSVNTNYNFYR